MFLVLPQRLGDPEMDPLIFKTLRLGASAVKCFSSPSFKVHYFPT
jgi:hypothetical protein